MVIMEYSKGCNRSLGIKCVLCGGDILRGDRIFKTNGGGYIPSGHPLCRYDDAHMHWSCYDAWEDRETFANICVDKLASSRSKVKEHVVLEKTPNYLLWVDFEHRSKLVLITLCDCGSTFPIPLCSWDAHFSDTGELWTFFSYFKMHPTEWELLQGALVEIKEKGWDREKILSLVARELDRPSSFE
jgi:hypothetical protein